MVNCLSHALKTEGISSHPGNLDWYLTPEQAVQEKCEEFKRKSRKMSGLEDKLEENEWMVAMFGFFVIRTDYDGYPTLKDYHLVLKEDDGRWTHRKTWGAEIETVDMAELLKAFEKEKIPVQYFAICESET